MVFLAMVGPWLGGNSTGTLGGLRAGKLGGEVRGQDSWDRASWRSDRWSGLLGPGWDKVLHHFLCPQPPLGREVYYGCFTEQEFKAGRPQRLARGPTPAGVPADTGTPAI